MIQDIPKLYTALAEWLACVLFVRLLPQRYDAVKTAGILAAALPLFGLVQWLIGIVPLSLWIPGMIVALVLMYATIWLCCRLNFCDTGFWWALAFTLAEFVASLEWQLYSFGASKMPGSWWIQGLFLLAFYGGGFGVFLRLEQKRLRDKAPLHMTRRESISAAVIAICTFLISNISYVTTNTPFSGRMTTEIFWIRTLVDFAGVAVLLSMQDRWQDMQTQHELTAIQTLLKRQYEQYRISRDNSEAINRKYHDLKHQIQVIRMESDAARREEYLSQLEKGMQSLGVNQHTGNDVLDTILSDKQLYCSQHQITLTIVADGARLDFIETMDICSIFGNALDNAIEGVEKLADPQQRLIRVAVYHRQTNRHSYSRQACAEKLRRNENGAFLQAEVTSCGLNDGPLKGKGRYEARIACNLWGKDGTGRYDGPFPKWRLRNHPYFTQDGPDREDSGNQYIANMRDGAVAGFKYFAFKDAAEIKVHCTGSANGRLQVSTAPDFSTLCADIFIKNGSQVGEKVSLTIPDGTYPLYFRFTGSGKMNFHWFELQ